MDDITLNKMYFSAIPDFYRVGIELFEIFVVSVNEQNGHRQVSQNILVFASSLAMKPQTPTSPQMIR